MQFTILGTTVSIVRNPREDARLSDHLVVRVRNPEQMLLDARRKALEISASADLRTFF